MKIIYTYGYTGASVATLGAILARTGALLVDVRFSPASRNPEWSGSRLRATFGEEYLHLKALGNANYRNGGPIELVDLEGAAKRLRPILEGRSVVLLCACKDHAVCHRTVAAVRLAGLLGAKVEHLGSIEGGVELIGSPINGGT
jgi:uncharacterized protein (DUF488 family)